MKPLYIHNPCRPFEITQHWGNPNPAYEQFGFSRHNGVDFTGWSNFWRTRYPVYCPVEDFTVHKVQYVPNGGGHEIWLISNETRNINGKECHALIVLMHAERIYAKPGDKPAIGELLMIADNTGFSTGLHTHLGLYRVFYDGVRITGWIDQNDAAGSYNPEIFFTGKFATDYASTATLTKNIRRYLGL